MLVSRRIAHPCVDAVRLLHRLLLELDAAALELLVRRPDVVGGEEEPACRALGHERLDWSRVSASKTGGPGTAIRVIATSGCPGTPTVSQRKFAHLGNGDVVAELEPELLGVEGEGLVLVVDPDLHGGQLLQHRWSSSMSERSPATLAGVLGACLLETCWTAAARTPAATQVGIRARAAAGGIGGPVIGRGAARTARRSSS